MKSDIEIAKEFTPRKISEIAAALGLSEDDLEYYGRYKAKVHPSERLLKGKLILVSAMTPTPQGDGKTTISIGLADGLRKCGKKSVLALREPSLGPVFGMKGGATGGGYSQVIPMEDINLHFTGDFHAITSANNLLCAVIDNSVYQGNPLNIDPRTVTLKRCLDMNDRTLRNIVIGLGGKSKGFPREDHFQITVASEIMAIFCLSKTMDELKANMEKIIVAETFDGKPVYAGDLNVAGSMAALLKDAFVPNLVQTLEGTPAFIHGGPFANIAHGCNSIAATTAALQLGDYVVTEAGFAADLGAEKFMDIKCRKLGVTPDCVVLVVTIKAMKHHGNGDIVVGFANVVKHYRNLTEKFGVNVVAALNQFLNDTPEEIALVKELCGQNRIPFVPSNGYRDGGSGCISLAEKVMELCEKPSHFHHLYELDIPLKDKILTVCRDYYGAGRVLFSPTASKKLAAYSELYPEYPVCVAKTPYSFSDDPKKLNVPENFEITIRDMDVKNGAGFIVVFLGDIMTMPGLPKSPNSERIDLVNGEIVGLM